MKRVQLQDFRVDGYVSIWLGDFFSEEELDYYLDHKFKNDFGFAIYASAAPEADVEDKAIDVRSLLSDYSFSYKYIDAAVQAANDENVYQATSAIIFHGFKYNATYVNLDATPPIKFIGAFLCT